MRHKKNNVHPSGGAAVSLALAVAGAARPSPLARGQTYTVTDLGTLGGTSSYAYAINASGQVVGYSLLAGNSVGHAFLLHERFHA